MAEPLDYQSRLPRNDAPPFVKFAGAAMPAELGAKVTTTDDHAGVRAVESALTRAGIRFFRVEGDARLVGRPVTIWCAQGDHARATAMAAEQFARRAKVKKSPPPKAGLTDRETIDDRWGFGG